MIIRKTLKIFLITVFCPALAGSQILNIDKDKLSPKKKDSADYFVVDINAAVQLYNRSAGEDDPVNFFGYNLGGDAGFIGEKHSFMLMNKYDFLRINDDTFLNTGYSHLRVVYNRENTVAYETFGQYQYDNFRGLHPRLLAGAGLRFSFIDNDVLTLRMGAGGMFEYEKWQHPYDDGSVYMRLPKSTNYLITRWNINEHVKLNGIFYFQTGYDKTIDAMRHRMSGEVHLNVNFTKNLRFVTSLTANYENRPVVAITPFIYSLKNGVSYSF